LQSFVDTKMTTIDQSDNHQSTEEYICESLIGTGVNGGTNLGKDANGSGSNSHLELIIAKMPNIKSINSEQGEVTDPFLFIIGAQEPQEPLAFGSLQNTKANKGRVTMAQIQTLNPLLYSKINSQYNFGGYISINGKRIERDQLETTKIFFGSHIGFVI
jgi:hypothetical protein